MIALAGSRAYVGISAMNRAYVNDPQISMAPLWGTSRALMAPTIADRIFRKKVF